MTTRLALLALAALLAVSASPAPPPCFLPGAECTPTPTPHYAAPCPYQPGQAGLLPEETPTMDHQPKGRCVYVLPALVNHRGLDVQPTETPESDPGIES